MHVNQSVPVALTKQELVVLRLLAARRTYAEIARDLYISSNTVKSHVTHVYEKLGVGHRADAIVRARELGILPPGEDVVFVRPEPSEALVLHSRELIAIIDGKLRLVWANPAFRDLLGEDPDDHVGQPAWDVVHPDDRDRLREIVAQVAEEPGASVTFDCRLAHADGTWRHVEVHRVNLLGDPALRDFLADPRESDDPAEEAEQDDIETTVVTPARRERVGLRS
jgi:PAS domain S-box-containing protein